MWKPSRWMRLAAVALLSLCGIAAAADKPAGAPLEFNWGAPTAGYLTHFVAKDLGLFEQAILDPQFFFFQPGAPLTWEAINTAIESTYIRQYQVRGKT